MNLNSMIHNYLTINKLHKIPIKIKEKEQGKQLYSIIEGDPYLTKKSNAICKRSNKKIFCLCN